MIAIVAAAENGGIGYRGGLLFSLPTDMKHFRTCTEGKTVIMGRKTLDSLPKGQPLKNRRNIVLTRGDVSVPGAEVVNSVEEALRLVEGEEEDAVFLIGGEQVYRALLPYCRKVCMTRVFAAPPADAFFPEMSGEEWKITRESEIFCENGVSFRFVDYERL